MLKCKHNLHGHPVVTWQDKFQKYWPTYRWGRARTRAPGAPRDGFVGVPEAIEEALGVRPLVWPAATTTDVSRRIECTKRGNASQRPDGESHLSLQIAMVARLLRPAAAVVEKGTRICIVRGLVDHVAVVLIISASEADSAPCPPTHSAVPTAAAPTDPPTTSRTCGDAGAQYE
jgi:hypothetical protein